MLRNKAIGDSHFALRCFALCVLLPCLAIASIGAVASAAGASDPYVKTEGPGAQVCYVASEWGPVADSKRPCITIDRPQEDGSTTVYVGDAAADKAVCHIRNVDEERGKFYVLCQRVPHVNPDPLAR